MTVIRTAIGQTSGLVLGLTIGAVLFFGGFLVATSVMDAGAAPGDTSNVHACVSYYTGLARIMRPGQAPNCKSNEMLVELGGGAAASDQEARLSALEAQVPDCLSDEAGDAVFTDCDVEIRNGLGNTETTNGKGNLIVGYNENSEGFNRDGSHNIVVGNDHGYSSYGGFVAGQVNQITAAFASVSGGQRNTASGPDSSVSGGRGNVASGQDSSVSAGISNNATGDYSSVSGGAESTASGSFSSVSGGNDNTASGITSSVSGGNGNEAGGAFSSVSGGVSRNAPGLEDWAAGSLSEDF